MTPRRTPQPQTQAARPSRAFTLIELLIVIGIIAVLISMSLVVGSKVIEGGKGRATQNVIRVLDESRGAWTLNADVPLPSVVTITDDRGFDREYPIIDARRAGSAGGNAADAWQSLDYYTALVMQDASIRPMFEQLDSAFTKRSSGPPPAQNTGESESWAIAALAINDAWGRPLRVVHPAFHGGHGEFWDPTVQDTVNRDILRVKVPTRRGTIRTDEFSRSYRPFKDDDKREGNWIGDADEGMCIGGTAYFYSAGDDGDPGTRRNNIYSTVPRFPVETRDFK